MRRAHTLFVPADGGKVELLFAYEMGIAEQKTLVKEITHEGRAGGGVIEFWTSDGDIFRYKVPPILAAPVLPEPSPKLPKKLSK